MAAAWLGALLVGASLGLFGSGGSILTVPILVGLLGREPAAAVPESLAIVAAIAAFGTWLQARRGEVDLRLAFWLGLPGVAGAWLGARLHQLVPVWLSTLAFAALIAAAGVALWRRASSDPPARARPSRLLGALAGAAIGVLTGFLGVGGGFLVAPALRLLAGLPLSLAVGTSLAIVALQSAAGLAAHLLQGNLPATALDLPLVGLFAAVGIAGSAAGLWIGPRIPVRALQRSFAALLLLLGAATAFEALQRAGAIAGAAQAVPE